MAEMTGCAVSGSQENDVIALAGLRAQNNKEDTLCLGFDPFQMLVDSSFL